MILHKFSTSPFTSSTLEQCINRFLSGDKVLLTQDAIYACVNTAIVDVLTPFSPIYYIQDDSQARGVIITSPLFQGVSYKEFVELTLTCKQVISW